MLGRRDVGLVGRLLRGTMLLLLLWLGRRRLLLLLVLGVGRRRHRIGVDGLRRAGVVRLVRHVDGFPDRPWHG